MSSNSIKFQTSPNPSINYFPPSEDSARSSALVIFAGGGYWTRSEHEGAGYAQFFASQGFHCFVCDYRVAEEEGKGLGAAPLEDALFAVSYVQDHAEEFGYSPKKIGVVGSSAGGHLAAHVSTVSYRWGPGFQLAWTILAYPVIALSGPFAHLGSGENLLGPDAGDRKVAEHSPHRLVHEQTPPAYLWHTMEDGAVPLENSLLYADALRKSKVPFELHVTEKGRHGLGRSADFAWAERAIQWLECSEKI